MDAPEQQHIRDRYTALCVQQGRGERTMEGAARYELYDIESDPGEWNDCSDSHPDVVRHLREVYEDWFANVGLGV